MTPASARAFLLHLLLAWLAVLAAWTALGGVRRWRADRWRAAWQVLAGLAGLAGVGWLYL